METQEYTGEYTTETGRPLSFWTFGFNEESARSNALRLWGGHSYSEDKAISKANFNPFNRRSGISPIDKL